MSDVYTSDVRSNELNNLIIWILFYGKNTFTTTFTLKFVEKISAHSIFKFVKRSYFYIQSMREIQTRKVLTRLNFSFFLKVLEYTTLNELFNSIQGEHNLWQRVHLPKDQGGVIASISYRHCGESLQGVLHGASVVSEEIMPNMS
jgi:hypothetical protein